MMASPQDHKLLKPSATQSGKDSSSLRLSDLGWTYISGVVGIYAIPTQSNSDSMYLGLKGWLVPCFSNFHSSQSNHTFH